MKFFLTGISGVGKTHMGKQWAAQYELPFIDLDEMIEKKTGKLIREIFLENGEQSFRETEHRMLISLEKTSSAIIACGGGTPCFMDNIQWMNQQGITIWLQQSLGTIAAQIADDKTVRPLLQQKRGKEAEGILEKLLAERTAYYTQSKYAIDLSTDYSRAIKNIFTDHA